MKIFESPLYPDGQVVMVGDYLRNKDFSGVTFVVAKIEGPEEITMYVKGRPYAKGPCAILKEDYLAKRA